MNSERLGLRRRLKLSFTLAVVFAVLVVQSVFLVPTFQGNLALAACFRASQSGRPYLAACTEGRATDTQQQAMALARTQMLWQSGDYLSLATNCGERLCDCFPNGRSNAPLVQERMEAYLGALSYRLVHGEFPLADECRVDLVSSQSAWRQANLVRASGNEELADALAEYAFVVDVNWQSQRERGCSAYHQALRYRTLGNQEAAKKTFQTAVNSLLPVYSPDDGPAVGCLSQSLLFLADIQVAAAEWDDAIQAYRRGVSISPKGASRGFDGMVQIWERYGSEESYVLQQLDALRTDVGANDPYLTSGPIPALLNAELFDAARQLLESAPPEIAEVAVIVHARGLLCEQEGDAHCARQAYARALAATRDDDPALAALMATDLARVTEAQGDVSQALDYQALAVELNPKFPALWLQLAQLHERYGDPATARRTLEEALAQHPGNDSLEEALNKLGESIP